MANVLPTRPRQMNQSRSIAVVASQYNPVYVQGLVENFRRELLAIAPSVSVTLHEVPGAFEIPVVASELAARGGIDAVVAFGVLLRGETPHADLVAGAVTRGLMDISVRNRVPVIHEVLLLADEAQAKARCLDAELNRGIEAARAAVRVSLTLAELRGR
jgi:6,7-dimethyl-8-ribityllumazine synthase